MLVMLFIWRWTQNQLGIEKPKEPKDEDDNKDEEEENKLDKEAENIPVLTIIYRVVSFCKFQWKWYILEIALFHIATGVRCVQPHYNAKLLSIFSNKEAILNFIATLTNHEAIFIYTIIVSIILYIVGIVLSGMESGISSYSSEIFKNRLRSHLFTSVLKQEIAFFDKHKTGDLISRVNWEVNSIRRATQVNKIFDEIVPLIYSLIFMSTISWRLTLANFVAMPFIAFCCELYNKKRQKFFWKTYRSSAKAMNVIEESISGIRTVKSFGCEEIECKRYHKHLLESSKLNKEKSIAYIIFRWVNDICDNLNYIFIVAYAIYLVMYGKILPEQLVEFWLYETSISRYLYNINYTLQTIQDGIMSARKVFSIIDREPKKIKSGTLKKPIDGKITFKDVCFTYPSRPNEKCLENLNFECQPGETIAFVGPSGVGKTTIIQLLKRFYDPDSGVVLVDDVPIDEYDSRFLHNSIALVAQEPILFDASINYNIKYGCDDWVTDKDVEEAAKQANIHDFILTTETGYNTLCGERGVALSGGQKQRIAIARALIRKPEILILDEATSALDAATEKDIQDTLHKISQNISVIIIAHRLSTVQRADTIFVLSDKKIVQAGSHKKLMQEVDGIYYNLVNKQILHEKEDTDEENYDENNNKND
uniref:ABC transporter n=1 Tax=Acrobeloides nanus TaxID=290746 RepID=A0A914E0Y2_9BILA